MDGRGLEDGHSPPYDRTQIISRGKKNPTLSFSFLDGHSTAVGETSLIDLRWWMLPWYVRACAGALAFCLDHFFSHAIYRGSPFGRPASQPTSSPPPQNTRPHSCRLHTLIFQCPTFITQVYSSLRPCCYMAWCRTGWITNRVDGLVWDGRNRRKMEQDFECILWRMRLYCGYRNWRIARLPFFFSFAFSPTYWTNISFLDVWCVRIIALKPSHATSLLG